jgi:hypothetical protein
VQPSAPRLLTKTRDGRGEAILLHPDYRLVSEEAPALPGQVVMVYLVGLGAVTPPVAAGARAGDGQSAPLNETELAPEVLVAGYRAEVLWSGLAPYYAGLYQLNIRLPRYLPQGRHTIQVVAGSNASQAEVWMAGGAPVWRSVSRASVGAGGGTVSGAGPEVRIPAGALSANVKMTTSAPAVEVAPSELRVTGVWKVAGLPLESSAPIVLRLPVSAGAAPASGETVVFLKSEAEPDAGFTALRATVRGGYLEATLPATAPPASGATSKDERRREALIIPKDFTATVWGMAGFTPIRSPAGKFTVWVARGDDRDFRAAEDTGRILEEALTKLKAIGIETDTLRTTPIDIYLIAFSSAAGNLFLLDDEFAGMTESEVWGRDDMGLSLNLNTYRTNREVFRATAAHELFHIFQSYYDPRRWAQRTFTGASWLWLWEAASVWFEQKNVNSGDNHLADVTRTNADFLFRGGLEQSPGWFSSAAARSHGYGAAMFLRYFIRGDDRRVGQLIRRSRESTGVLVREFRHSPVDALRLEDPLLAERWVDFCQQYFEGKVHPFIDYKLLTLNDKGKSKVPGFTFATSSDTGTVFRWEAPNLSAAHYQVKFTRATLNWAPNTTLTLRLRDPNRKAVAFVYRMGQVQPVLMQRFTEEHRISNAETLVDGRTSLYILIANPHYDSPYNGSTSIELEVSTEPLWPRYDYVSAGLEIGITTRNNITGQAVSQ